MSFQNDTIISLGVSYIGIMTYMENIKMKFMNLVGRKFNKLLVKEMITEGNHTKIAAHTRKWLCQCDCGNKRIVLGKELRRAHVTACEECAKSSLVKKNHHKWSGYEEIHGRLWGRAFRSARARGIEFNVSIEEGWKQFLKQNKKCALSGIELNFQSRANCWDQTASLDRKSSLGGYTKDNIQWLHKDVNKMKMDIPEEIFIEYCKIIAKNKENSNPNI